MGDLQRIHTLIARVRRRLRMMSALDTATTAAIPAVAGALAILWLSRMQLLGARPAVLALATLAGAVLVVAAASAARRFPAKQVATRIDRASGLSDRLGTACDFSERWGEQHHPDTRRFMQAAISDGVAAVPRANVKAAAPFRLPRDLRPLGAFLAVAVAVTLLSFGPDRPDQAAAAATRRPPPPPAEPAETLDREDVDYQQELVEDMKELAQQTGDQALLEMAKELQALLDKAEHGELSKQDLITRMEALEKKYMKASGQDVDSTLADLKEQGKALKKKPLTKKLGEAMEAGDLEQAQKELEKLAEKMEQGELKPEEQKQVAEALEQAGEKQEQKQAQADKKQQAEAQKAVQKQQEEVRRLQKKVDQDPKDAEARRTLQKERRELDRLEREQKAKQDKPERQLDRLTRNLKDAAESLRQKNQQQSAKKLRDAAGDTKKVQDEMRRQGNQKKIQSQLGDLKQAIRRARPKKGGGQKGEQARQQRIQEWERRAGGQRGNSQAWRGQGDQPGDKEGQLQKGQGQSKQYGDEPGPPPLGDPTDRFGKTKNEQLSGIQGQGPSRRETILTSAKQGFAHTGYRKVYADYKKAAEEVMTQEKVPQGYQYYVKRYFQRIKPHSMD